MGKGAGTKEGGIMTNYKTLEEVDERELIKRNIGCIKQTEIKIKERIINELPIGRRRYFEIVFDELGINNRLIDEIFGYEDLDDIIYDIDQDSKFRTFTSQLIMFIDCIG